MIDDNTIDHIFKVILLGNSSVGKSQILMKFTKNQFNENSSTTMGVEFSAKMLAINDKRVRIQVWDTAGQEKFQSIARAYYKGAVGALLVYDITQPDSFKSMEKWLSEIRQWADQQNIVCMLIGNKNDLEQDRKVFKDEAMSFAQQKKMGFLETSAKTGFNIDFAFKSLAEEILRSLQEDKSAEVDDINPGKYKRNQSPSVLRASDSMKKKKNKDDGCC